jgi:hypothetical protein
LLSVDKAGSNGQGLWCIERSVGSVILMTLSVPLQFIKSQRRLCDLPGTKSNFHGGSNTLASICDPMIYKQTLQKNEHWMVLSALA